MTADISHIPVKKLDEVKVPWFMNDPMSTGIEVIDNLFNGDGILRSQVITLDAYRGSGKTTLLLQMLDSMYRVADTYKCLFVSREEPDFQLRKNSMRLNLTSPLELVGDEHDVYLEDIVDLMDHYDLIVVDSYSCLHSREGLKRDSDKMKVLKHAAKDKVCAVILVLHQTKSGAEKGGSDVAHMGDTCVSIAHGDEDSFGEDVRIISVSKNRFGACGKVILRLARNGWAFENPIEDSVNNESNKTENKSAQAKRPAERKAILKFMDELEEREQYLTLGDLSMVIDDEDDPAAFGRHERHLKEMEKQGLVLKVGRGQRAHWELTADGVKKLGA